MGAYLAGLFSGSHFSLRANAETISHTNACDGHTACAVGHVSPLPAWRSPAEHEFACVARLIKGEA